MNQKTPIYTLIEGEMMLDAPVQKVWPHVLNYTAWQNYSTVQHISGEPGQEGAVTLLKKEEAGSQSTPYYARTIRLEPYRRVIWKTFRDHAEYFGIVEFRVDDVHGRARFSWKLLYEHVVSHKDDAELQALRQLHYANFSTLATTIFPKLKVVVEGER